MGMWDKDKEIGRRLDSVFKLGDYLVIYSAEEAGEISTNLGMARKTVIQAAPLENPADIQEVSTLSSAIAAKAELAEENDFPAVCQLLQVPTDKGNPALVLQFVKQYEPDSSEVPATADQEIPY